jgi:hypothetical protein
METTESKYISKYVRVNLPDVETLRTVWKRAKLEEAQAVKASDDCNLRGIDLPEGATRRNMKWGEFALYVCHNGGGRVDDFEPSYGDQADCIGEGSRQHIADVALQAFDDPRLVTEGFEIYAESRLYFEYTDDEGEIVPNEYGLLDDPTGFAVNVLVYKHTPVKATESVLRIIQAYQHFLFYIDLGHLKANDPWKDQPGMYEHFEAKLRGFYTRESSAGGPHLIDCDSIVKWVQEMTGHNQAKLFQYILNYHIDRY